MVYPEVCSLIKNNAICEHTLKLTSEATVCWCPLILSTIGVFSTFHFESCTFLNPLSAVMSIGSSSADGGRKYLTKNLCLQPMIMWSVNIWCPNRQENLKSTICNCTLLCICYNWQIITLNLSQQGQSRLYVIIVCRWQHWWQQKVLQSTNNDQ